MNRVDAHPEDFGPYLDREVANPAYENIRTHLADCGLCREEIRNWQAIDALVRENVDRLEVPPFQWQRIEAQLSRPKPGRLTGFLLWLPPRKPAWSAALATLVLVAGLWTGLVYQSNAQEKKEILLAIGRYAAVVEQQTGAGENPFTDKVADQTHEKNPFAVRR